MMSEKSDVTYTDNQRHIDGLIHCHLWVLVGPFIPAHVDYSNQGTQKKRTGTKSFPGQT